MKLSELSNNKAFSPETAIYIKLLEFMCGDREIDLDELEKMQPGIKSYLLNLDFNDKGE